MSETIPVTGPQATGISAAPSVPDVQIQGEADLVSSSAGAKWGAPVISVAVLILLAGALLVNALVFKDLQTNTLIVGAIIPLASAAVYFWVGSSHGSQKKDALAAALSLKRPAQPTEVGKP